jgi:hypothetical protein
MVTGRIILVSKNNDMVMLEDQPGLGHRDVGPEDIVKFYRANGTPIEGAERTPAENERLLQSIFSEHPKVAELARKDVTKGKITNGWNKLNRLWKTTNLRRWAIDRILRRYYGHNNFERAMQGHMFNPRLDGHDIPPDILLEVTDQLIAHFREKANALLKKGYDCAPAVYQALDRLPAWMVGMLYGRSFQHKRPVGDKVVTKVENLLGDLFRWDPSKLGRAIRIAILTYGYPFFDEDRRDQYEREMKGILIGEKYTAEKRAVLEIVGDQYCTTSNPHSEGFKQFLYSKFAEAARSENAQVRYLVIMHLNLDSNKFPDDVIRALIDGAFANMLGKDKDLRKAAVRELSNYLRWLDRDDKMFAYIRGKFEACLAKPGVGSRRCKAAMIDTIEFFPFLQDFQEKQSAR